MFHEHGFTHTLLIYYSKPRSLCCHTKTPRCVDCGFLGILMTAFQYIQLIRIFYSTGKIARNYVYIEVQLYLLRLYNIELFKKCIFIRYFGMGYKQWNYLITKIEYFPQSDSAIQGKILDMWAFKTDFTLNYIIK